MKVKQFMKIFFLLSLVLFAKDPDIDISQSYVVFDAVTAGTSSQEVTLTLTNKSSGDMSVGNIILQGAHKEEFNITSDGCSSQTIVSDGVCDIKVLFSPTNKGSKNAILHISYDSKSLNVFLSNSEDNAHNVKKRIPPVMYDLNISEELNASSSYTFTWSAVGYNNSYKTNIVFFDCTGLALGACGSSYSNSEKFHSSIFLTPTTETSDWSYKDQTASEFNYSYTYTIPDTRANGSGWDNNGTQIVIRFYVLSNEDEANGEPSLSLIIPGNLSQNYYDNEGRRIEKIICPSGGCQ